MSRRQVTVPELARATNLNPRTIRRWCKDGKILCYSVGDGCRWSIDVIHLAEQLGIRVEDILDRLDNE